MFLIDAWGYFIFLLYCLLIWSILFISDCVHLNLWKSRCEDGFIYSGNTRWTLVKEMGRVGWGKSESNDSSEEAAKRACWKSAISPRSGPAPVLVIFRDRRGTVWEGWPQHQDMVESWVQQWGLFLHCSVGGLFSTPIHTHLIHNEMLIGSILCGFWRYPHT